ncbi:MAG: cyclic peptide export ABC transporter [Methylococcaceae bacterium]|nr:MAG: cyclic peptide export ABC transporter [Methylococcaceae bacterium]
MMRLLLQNSRRLLSVSILTGLLSGLSGAGLIATINLALNQAPGAFADLAWFFWGLCLLMVLSRVVSAFLLVRLSQNAIFRLRVALSRQILAASLNRLQELGPPRILACLTQDVAALAEAFRWLPVMCVNSAIIAGCFIYLGWLSGSLLVLVVATIILGLSSYRLIQGRAMGGLRMARECDDALYGHMRSLTQGIKELKLNDARRAAFLTECLEASALHYRRHYLNGMRLFIFAANWGNSLFYVLIGSLLFILPAYLGEVNTLNLVHVELTAEVLRGYCLTILYMMAPLEILVEGIPAFGRAGIALKKIQALGGATGEPTPGTTAARAALPRTPALELAGVLHHYAGGGDDRRFCVGPIDLTLQPGELVFLVGGNGSGKTTLALLLVGLYLPEQGEIRLDGRRVGPAGLEQYRNQFAAVFSDFYLFDSLLGFDSPELDAEARAYLTRLQLEHKVQIDNGVFSTLDLSQGQRKRLALLVAYLEDKPFYVFDEWAADQDPVFKNIFYGEILPALKAKGKTVVVITHDDAYFQMADRCLRLEEGRLFEIV